MTDLAPPAARAGVPVRVLRAGRDLVVGSLLCLTPLTALVALGWLTRRMAARIGHAPVQPGWLLGPSGKGRGARLFGGLASNIRAGVMTAVGLAALTLPFTMLWLGAWWAGWENSFNKGYEQSGIGPAVWFTGALISLPILAHLPMSLAHAATEGRLGAFFEYRRIRSLAASAGWRLPWLALISVTLSAPLLGLRALPVFVEGIVPAFADMTAVEQMQVAQRLDIAGAVLAFVVLLFLRDRASAIYARAVARDAREPSRPMAAIWLLLTCVIWAALPILILLGQFMNYSPVLWLTHPVFLLPWAG